MQLTSALLLEVKKKKKRRRGGWTTQLLHAKLMITPTGNQAPQHNTAYFAVFPLQSRTRCAIESRWFHLLNAPRLRKRGKQLISWIQQHIFACGEKRQIVNKTVVFSNWFWKIDFFFFCQCLYLLKFTLFTKLWYNFSWIVQPFFFIPTDLNKSSLHSEATNKQIYIRGSYRLL